MLAPLLYIVSSTFFICFNIVLILKTLICAFDFVQFSYCTLFPEYGIDVLLNWIEMKSKKKKKKKKEKKNGKSNGKEKKQEVE